MPPSGTVPGTIYIELPPIYTTSTIYLTNSDEISRPATTYTAAPYTGGTVPGTIVEEVPGTYTTATSYYDQATPSTTTIAAWTGGSAPGTVLVLEVCIRDKVESEQSF